MIGVVAHLRRQIKRAGQARLACIEVAEDKLAPLTDELNKGPDKVREAIETKPESQPGDV